MIRKSKKYERPQKLYNKPRILKENKLIEIYGLKNKKEIWKADSKVKYFRDRAKILITAGEEEQKIFFNKLNKIGFKVDSVSDVLALEKEDLLKRRLSTIVWKKGIADSAKQARQYIVHKKIIIGKNVVNVPGYLVKVDEDKLIKLKKKVKKPKQEKNEELLVDENNASEVDKKLEGEENENE
jgi:small subunit ribosomal protein S4